MDPLTQGTPNYSQTYQPIDPVKYHNQEAQMHYEVMRSKMARTQMLMGQTFAKNLQVTTGMGSLREMRRGVFFDPESNEIHNQTYQQGLYADDLSDRGFEAMATGYTEFGKPAAELLGGLFLDRAVVNPQMRRQAAMRAAAKASGRKMGGSILRKSALSRMAIGMGAGFGIAMAATAAVQATGKFLGVGEAFSQFDEINDIKMASESWMSGVASDPTSGRMDRVGAKEVKEFLKEQTRYNMSRKGGESFDDIMQDVGIFNDFELMQGVKDAEDFGKRFSGLKESVRKITETLGKTFKEGAELIAGYKNMGIRPDQATNLIQGVHSAALMGGISFDRANAAGMKTALALQGSGLTAQAGVMLGARSEGLSQQLSDRIMNGDGQILNSRHLYNLGGQQGARMALERGAVGLMQSQLYNASMMASFDPETGEIDMGKYMNFAAKGDISGAMNRIGQNFDSAEDMLMWQSKQPEIASRMMEGRPETMYALGIQTVFGAARQMGMDPNEMSMGQLAQLTPMLTQGQVSSDQFMLFAESVLGGNDGLGREQLAMSRQGQVRARAMYGGGIASDIGYGIRTGDRTASLLMGYAGMATGNASLLTNSIMNPSMSLSDVDQFSASSKRKLANFMFEGNDSVARTLDRSLRGVYTMDVDFDMAEVYERSGDFERLEGRGQFYDDTFFATSDQADLLDRMTREGGALEMERLKLSSKIRGKGRDRFISLHESERTRLLAFAESAGKDMTALNNAITNSVASDPSDDGRYRYRVSVDALSDMGIGGIEKSGLFEDDGIMMYDQAQIDKLTGEQGDFAEQFVKARAEQTDQTLSGDNFRLANDVFMGVVERAEESSGDNMQGLVSKDRERGTELRKAMMDELSARGISADSARGQMVLARFQEQLANTYGVVGEQIITEMGSKISNLDSFSQADTAKGIFGEIAGEALDAFRGGWFGTGDDDFEIVAERIQESDRLVEDFGNLAILFKTEGEGGALFQEKFSELQASVKMPLDISMIEQAARSLEEREEDGVTGMQALMETGAQMIRSRIDPDNVGGTGTQRDSGKGGSVELVAANEAFIREQTEVTRQTARMLEQMIGTMEVVNKSVQANSTQLRRGSR